MIVLFDFPKGTIDTAKKLHYGMCNLRKSIWPITRYNDKIRNYEITSIFTRYKSL